MDSLSRMTPYEVVLSAYDMYGSGDPSEPVLFETTGEQPLQQRTNERTKYLLSARVIGPVLASLLIIFTSIVVAWTFYKEIPPPAKEASNVGVTIRVKRCCGLRIQRGARAFVRDGQLTWFPVASLRMLPGPPTERKNSLYLKKGRKSEPPRPHRRANRRTHPPEIRPR
ncbi:hypothetical protein HPB50_005666 [Hyalomma asiaticum]|uniref:Uncharacterized protein n=1 Tax=Hyalomma asiaticum TaxID=266040 RepID=A0ACB7S445_HYAAI|nr:hypothetical protein HPB50_005666 [Hyalomma asiaticum]